MTNPATQSAPAPLNAPKMEWVKRGLIFHPKGNVNWATNSALQPTAISLKPGVIRIYTGLRDDEGIARVGYVDVDSADPSRILGVSEKPCFDIGKPGHFDDNGVVPCSVVKHGDRIHMYYAGYQLVKRVRFLVLCSLAISEDGGETFTRVSPTPVFERTPDETLFRVIHTALFDQGKWRVWYGGGSEFLEGKNKTLPAYDIRYMESTDGVDFPKKGSLILGTSGDEYRIARPNVVRIGSTYHMFLCHGSESDPYSLGYASSPDGHAWVRDDARLNMQKTPGGFDSDMMAYPCFIQADGKSYLFYNGNDYGREGFGYAELTNPEIL